MPDGTGRLCPGLATGLVITSPRSLRERNELVQAQARTATLSPPASHWVSACYARPIQQVITSPVQLPAFATRNATSLCYAQACGIMLSDLVPASGGTGGLAPPVGAGEGRGAWGEGNPRLRRRGGSLPQNQRGPGGHPRNRGPRGNHPRKTDGARGPPRRCGPGAAALSQVTATVTRTGIRLRPSPASLKGTYRAGKCQRSVKAAPSSPRLLASIWIVGLSAFPENAS